MPRGGIEPPTRGFSVLKNSLFKFSLFFANSLYLFIFIDFKISPCFLHLDSLRSDLRPFGHYMVTAAERGHAKTYKRFVESLASDPDQDYVLWDSELKEFGIRVWPSGRKTYFLRYRAQIESNDTRPSASMGK